MLYEPDRAAPLDAPPWDPSRALAVAAEIAAEAARAFRPDADPPFEVHPLDDGPAAPASLYLGVPGVALALALLAEDGVPVDPDALRAMLAWTATAENRSPGLLIGVIGTKLVALRQGEVSGLEDAIREAIPRPERELLWAAPGAVFAALARWRATGDPAWRALAREGCDLLWSTWADGWVQDLYGRRRRMLGAAHGDAGALWALLAARDVLDPPQRDELHRRITRWATRTAAREGALANWPASEGEPPRLVQWCHGAPGVLIALAGAPRDPALDEVLLAGGELVWRFGRLRKGPGLCHGTAGNGWALLALAERTGDPRGLERARAFAMAAIAQADEHRARYGGRRFTLHTGDPGVALFLAACVRGDGAFPGVERF